MIKYLHQTHISHQTMKSFYEYTRYIIYALPWEFLCI